MDAEAEKQAAILRAEAKRESMIREAEGQAEAIKTVQQASADGIRMLNDAQASKEVLQLKSLEAFSKAADGKQPRSSFHLKFREWQVLLNLFRSDQR